MIEVKHRAMTIQPSFSAIEVDANTVDGWLEGQQAVLVDVRETTEYEQEHIPGSVLVPLSVFDPERFPWITNKKLVFHCAVGKRSAAEIGRASCRERGYISVVAVSLKKNKHTHTHTPHTPSCAD